MDFLARLLHNGDTRSARARGPVAPGPFKHAVLALRWFPDNTRVRRLAADNALSTSTAYPCLHEASSRRPPEWLSNRDRQ